MATKMKLDTTNNLLTPAPVSPNAQTIPSTSHITPLSTELQRIFTHHTIFYPNPSPELTSITTLVSGLRLYEFYIQSQTTMIQHPDILNFHALIRSKLNLSLLPRQKSTRSDFESYFQQLCGYSIGNLPTYVTLSRQDFLTVVRAYDAYVNLDSLRLRNIAIGNLAMQYVPMSDAQVRLENDDYKLLSSKFGNLCDYDGLLQACSSTVPHLLGINNERVIYLVKPKLDLNEYTSITCKFLNPTIQSELEDWSEHSSDTLSVDNLCTPLRAIEGIQATVEDLSLEGIDSSLSILDQDWVVTVNLNLADKVHKQFANFISTHLDLQVDLLSHNDASALTTLRTSVESTNPTGTSTVTLPLHSMAELRSNIFTPIKFTYKGKELTYLQVTGISDTLTSIWRKVIKPAIKSDFVQGAITKMKGALVQHMKTSVFDFIKNKFGATDDQMNSLDKVFSNGPSAFPDIKNSKDVLKRLLVGVANSFPVLTKSGTENSKLPSSYINQLSQDLIDAEKRRIISLPNSSADVHSSRIYISSS